MSRKVINIVANQPKKTISSFNLGVNDNDNESFNFFNSDYFDEEVYNALKSGDQIIFPNQEVRSRDNSELIFSGDITLYKCFYSEITIEDVTESFLNLLGYIDFVYEGNPIRFPIAGKVDYDLGNGYYLILSIIQ